MSFFSAGLSGMVNKRRLKVGKKATKKGNRPAGLPSCLRARDARSVTNPLQLSFVRRFTSKNYSLSAHRA